MTRINILYIYITLPVGGAEEVLKLTLQHLDRGRFYPIVCCMGSQGALGKEIEQMGVEMIVLNRRHKREGRPAAIVAMAKVMKERKVQIVHTHMYHGNTYGRIAALIAGVPVIISTVHTINSHRGFKRHLLNRLLSRYTDRIIAVSKAVRRDLIEQDHIPKDKIALLYNGIDYKRFQSSISKEEAKKRLGFMESEFIIGTVGRLEPPKGQRYLLEAASDLLKEFPQIRLLLIGDGKLRRTLEDHGNQLGLQGKQTYLGIRRDIPQILRAMDIFVLPSIREGLPIALLEAMASGCPCIASAVGGVPEVIEEQRSGLLVSPADTQGLKKALKKILSDRSFGALLGKAGMEKIRKIFNQDIIVRMLEDIYNGLLVEKGILS